MIPVAVCQAALVITGKDGAIALACQQGLLEINHYELLICDRMLDSITLLTRAAALFRDRCVCGLLGNEERCWKNLVASTALATVLVPKLGYDTVSRLVRNVLAADRPCLEAAVEELHLRREDVRATPPRRPRSDRNGPVKPDACERTRLEPKRR